MNKVLYEKYDKLYLTHQQEKKRTKPSPHYFDSSYVMKVKWTKDWCTDDTSHPICIYSLWHLASLSWKTSSHSVPVKEFSPIPFGEFTLFDIWSQLSTEHQVKKGLLGVWVGELCKDGNFTVCHSGNDYATPCKINDIIPATYLKFQLPKNRL